MRVRAKKTSYLEWIENDCLISICKEIKDKFEEKSSKCDINKNIIDPVSAAFEMLYYDECFEQWKKRESTRQVQKSLQNKIGELHEKVLSKVIGWEKLEKGLDIVNHKKKIFAEVKNKYNTTKGNHLVKLYDDIERHISGKEFAEYTGYYVAVISKRKVERQFTPSESGERRKANERIIEIDGESFYELATGDKDALRNLFKVIPLVVGDIMKKDATFLSNSKEFLDIINKALPK